MPKGTGRPLTKSDRETNDILRKSMPDIASKLNTDNIDRKSTRRSNAAHADKQEASRIKNTVGYQKKHGALKHIMSLPTAHGKK